MGRGWRHGSVCDSDGLGRREVGPKILMRRILLLIILNNYLRSASEDFQKAGRHGTATTKYMFVVVDCLMW